MCNGFPTLTSTHHDADEDAQLENMFPDKSAALVAWRAGSTDAPLVILIRTNAQTAIESLRRQMDFDFDATVSKEVSIFMSFAHS